MPRHSSQTLNPLQDKLLKWYKQNKRRLPWRVPGLSPYAVWVSEIMLQQTRVETVIPYYEKWMRTFPTVQALAQAPEQAVLNAWEGLGYYSRARNFHKAAKRVVGEYGGQLPRDLGELRKLPGIGRYTAGALASIIFGMDEPALDGNLKRVYARLFDVSEPVDSPAGEKILWELAKENLPEGKAADFNQALMDLGSMICLPKNPRCLLCPVMVECKARQNGTQDVRPVKRPKKDVPQYVHAAAIIVRRIARERRSFGRQSPKGANPPHAKVLLAQRPSTGLLGGMWEFPNGRVDATRNPARELAKVVKSGYSLRVRVTHKVPLGIFHHAYTHFKVTVHAFMCEPSSEDFTAKNQKWVAVKDLNKYPMGKIDRQIANALKQNQA
jgi:A/G-specific adenine glycosylase